MKFHLPTSSRKSRGRRLPSSASQQGREDEEMKDGEEHPPRPLFQPRTESKGTSKSWALLPPEWLLAPHLPSFSSSSHRPPPRPSTTTTAPPISLTSTPRRNRVTRAYRYLTTRITRKRRRITTTTTSPPSYSTSKAAAGGGGEEGGEEGNETLPPPIPSPLSATAEASIISSLLDSSRHDDEASVVDYYAYQSQGIDTAAMLRSDGPPPKGESMLMLHNLLRLSSDHRFNIASHVLARLESFVLAPPSGREEEALRLHRALTRPKVMKEITRIKERFAMIQQAVDELDEPGEWIATGVIWGVKTEYQINADGTLRVRMQGDIQGCAVDPIAVLREGSNYTCWLPFCDKGVRIHEEKLAVVLWLHLAIPFFPRDVLLDIWGVPLEEKDGSLSMLVLQSPDAFPEGIEVPPEPSGWGGARLNISDFKYKMKVSGPNSTHSTLVVTADFNAALPQTILNFFTRKIAGMFLVMLRKECNRLERDYQTHPLGQLIRTDPFYRYYLAPLLETQYQARGWEWHPKVLDGITVEGEEETKGEGGVLSTVLNNSSSRGAIISVERMLKEEQEEEGKSSLGGRTSRSIFKGRGICIFSTEEEEEKGEERDSSSPLPEDEGKGPFARRTLRPGSPLLFPPSSSSTTQQQQKKQKAQLCKYLSLLTAFLMGACLALALFPDYPGRNRLFFTC